MAEFDNRSRSLCASFDLSRSSETVSDAPIVERGSEMVNSRQFPVVLGLELSDIWFEVLSLLRWSDETGGKKIVLPHRIKRDINIRDVRAITDLATEEEWNDIYEDMLTGRLQLDQP